MRVFLSEYLTCGACPAGGTEASLAQEGAAMLRALAADAAAVSGSRVVVTWAAGLPPFAVPGVEVRHVRSSVEEGEVFRRLAAEADVTFVLAPEFGRLLGDRVREAAVRGGRPVASTAEAIALCGDKLRLFGQLASRGVPTIETAETDFAELRRRIGRGPAEGWVVKPRYGAGAVDLFRVRSGDELDAAERAYAGERRYGEPLVQPFVSGTPASVAAIVSAAGVELFPVAGQRFSGGWRPKYLGGRLCGENLPKGAVAEAVREALAAVPGLRGYVGVDLLLPDLLPDAGDVDAAPVVVEINPRLTTSYLGYRRLAAGNLAERVLTPDDPRPPVRWRAGWVEYGCDGAIGA